MLSNSDPNFDPNIDDMSNTIAQLKNLTKVSTGFNLHVDSISFNSNIQSKNEYPPSRKKQL